MSRNVKLRTMAAILMVVLLAGNMARAVDKLEAGFGDPSNEYKPWCYWWWLNGNASKEGITRDFEEMREHGISGVNLMDAASEPGVPRGPAFMSGPWRELFRHTVREADRCGIALSVNLCSGWNAGGPWVIPECAAKKLVANPPLVVQGGGPVQVTLPTPKLVRGYYQDIAVLASPVGPDEPRSKARSTDGEIPRRLMWNRARTIDVTRFMNPQGQLSWNAPAGHWQVLRIGMTLYGKSIAYCGSGPAGLEIDPMSAGAMDLHFAETGAKLIADAGPLAGVVFQYVFIDSWELGQPTWTPKMCEEFQKRRGYDLLPYLPGLLDQPMEDQAEYNRFAQDFRRTVAELVAQNYYGRLQELAVKNGLRGSHSESGGPYFSHWLEPLECLGGASIPMGEFWKRNWEPDGGLHWSLNPKVYPGRKNPSLKEAVSAAHIYGKPFCQAESFTSLGCDWMDAPWTLKAVGDLAYCHGLGRMVFHKWHTQMDPQTMPGMKWNHVGTDFNYKVTWWPMSSGWLQYLARCQYLLRQGLFVADFAYLQSERVPGFIPLRDEQEPLRPAGFDYDAINAHALLTRASARDGRLTLPDGMSYRYLVLPHQKDAILAPATLEKVKELAKDGVAVIGPKGLAVGVPGLRQDALDRVVRADGLNPDVEFRDAPAGALLDWIHRRDGETEIYFLSNQGDGDATAEVAFRVAGKQPELWDAVTGRINDLPQWRPEQGRTVVPMQFAPRQSWFVVFRKPAAKTESNGKNFPELKLVQELTGPWDVQFDEKWFYPDNGTGGKLRFEKLEDWTQRLEDAVKYYSGIATYRKSFKASPAAGLWLDLGKVKNVARVRLNGRELGIVWTAPWRLALPAEVLKAGENALEIEVANLWPNRLMGDDQLPKEQRRTVTNVNSWFQAGRTDCAKCKARKESGKYELFPSGLLGPVRVMVEK